MNNPLRRDPQADYFLVEQPYPHFIKYMGSKSKIMDFVLEGINTVYNGGKVCDLFAGSASLAGALRSQVPVHSNDIQNYSAVLADTYLNCFASSGMPSAEDILSEASVISARNQRDLGVRFDYSAISSLEEFNEIELRQQSFINRDFDYEWHLFAKFYSGTWWSLEQCIWIDAIREIADRHQQTPYYSLILSSLMFAMAYTSQGTGHYAQYRDAKTESSMKDILLYRRRAVADYFKKKYSAVARELPTTQSEQNHVVTSLDFKDCLSQFDGGTIYADPPYCFVHYSRFYHAIETLVLYDYPAIQEKGGNVVKGRYRESRHQSPFCIKTQVTEAFTDLFKGASASNSNLVLSYSNTGMISIDEIWALAHEYFPSKSLDILTTDHKHMTLGRQNDRHRDVEECLLLVA